MDHIFYNNLILNVSSEWVENRKAGKSKGLFDYLTELMKSKLRRGENVGKYRKEIFWRRSRKDLILATGETLRKSFICQILKIDFSSEKRWLRVFEIGMNIFWKYCFDIFYNEIPLICLKENQYHKVLPDV